MSSGKSYLLQETYVQKSRIFLFPLVGIPNSKHFRPTNTYIASENLICDAYPEGLSYDDKTLIVLYSKSYKKKDDDLYEKIKDNLIKKMSSDDDIPSGWDTFETKVLLSNRNFIAFHESDEEYIYTFDLSDYEDDWNNFLKGKYSLFKENTKDKILRFRKDVLSDQAKHRLYCYLYPTTKECIMAFAKELEMDVKDLMEVKELCSKPDLLQETYKHLLYEVKD